MHDHTGVVELQPNHAALHRPNPVISVGVVSLLVGFWVSKVATNAILTHCQFDGRGAV